jgi:hypothetical protein
MILSFGVAGFRKFIVLALALCLGLHVRSQDRPIAARSAGAEENFKQLLTELPCKESKRAVLYEDFINALKRRVRGDGDDVHYPWMDKMRRFGIKQLFFVVHFSQHNGAYRYKITNVKYMRRYYCFEDEIKGGKLLRQIRQSGLEDELKEAAIAREEKFDRAHPVPGYIKEGERYGYLIDDEALPLLSGFVT